MVGVHNRFLTEGVFDVDLFSLSFIIIIVLGFLVEDPDSDHVFDVRSKNSKFRPILYIRTSGSSFFYF